MDKVYIAIDLKSFYASVECVERGLSLFNTEETIQSRENKEKALKKEGALQEAMLTIKHKFGKNAVLKDTNFTEGAAAKDLNRTIGGHKE